MEGTSNSFIQHKLRLTMSVLLLTFFFKWQRLSIRKAFWLLLKYDYPTTKCRYKLIYCCVIYCNVHICSYYYYPGTTTLTAYSCLSHWTSHLWPYVQLKQSLTSANLPTSVSNMSKTSRMCLSFPTASSVFLFLFSHLSFTSKMVFSKPSLLFKWPISFWLWRSVTIALIFHFEFLPNWLLFCAQSMIFLNF